MESSICDMEKSLSEFHRYKHAILEAGARRGKSKEMDHFRIPKLELIQSFGCTIRNVDSLIQYTADVSERLLIMHCKGPFSHTNRQKTQFTRQIVMLLDREESSRLFNLYTLLRDKKFSLTNMLSVEGDVPQHSDPTLDWVLRVSPTDKSRFKGPWVIRNLFSKGLVSDDAMVAFHLTVKSDFADKSSNHLVTMYALPDFATHLQAYITMTCDNASRFQARSLKGWLKFRIQQQSWLQPCNMMVSQQIQALLPSDEYPFGKCDALLVRSASDSESVDVVQVRAIFALSPRGSPLPVGLSTPLLYVQHFTFTGTPADHPDVGMFSLRHKFVSNPDSSLCQVGSIVSMLDVVHAVELISKYGASARHDVTSEMCLEVYDDFYLNNFSDKEWLFKVELSQGFCPITASDRQISNYRKLHVSQAGFAARPQLYEPFVANPTASAGNEASSAVLEVPMEIDLENIRAVVLKPSTSTDPGETTGRGHATTTNEVPGDIQPVPTVFGNTQVAHMDCIPGPAKIAVNAIGLIDTTMTQLDAINTEYCQTLSTFSTVVNGIIGIHPYAQMAFSTLNRAFKLILLQASLDASIRDLVTRIEQTYELILENRSSSKINATKDVLVEIAQVIQECAQFITKYSETKTFWSCLGKNVLLETMTKVANYNQKLEKLMQELRD
ncbi:hypothetical protein SCLCIDRAFT_19907 [Scleroderma citrinum Foug A]|uniref:DUF6830 domain-containing protein n=1 Tax=Scleroderma citrinum Foug A TaxID=1036808 RepID=A0A0C3EN72_9AGAM|nr:hypothetical protein SCLCIDRAFT_19907 [Scleroderma citrinum Foug A]